MKNKKIIRLTEQDLEKMVRRIIKEDTNVDNSLLQKIKSLNPMKSKSKSSRIKYYNNNVELVAVKDKNVLTISGYYFLSDLGWRPTNWSISRPLDQKMTESFKALWNQNMPPVETVHIFNHKPEELKGALITKPDFDKTSDDLGQIFGEDYMSDGDYETSTPIKPITIHGKTYKFVEDLPIRELGIGSYVIQDGIVMVDGDTPLQDWLDNVMGGMEGDEDYMSEDERKVIKTSQLVNQFYDLLEQDLGYSMEEVDEIFQEVGDEPEMIMEFLSDLLSDGHGQMINQKIIDLMSKLTPMADAFRDDEDYMEQGFKKPGMFQKLKKQARNLVGVEDDRETLDQIYRMIKMGRVESIRKQDAGLTAWVNGKALIVDRLTPEIIYAGKTLDLVDTDLEVDNLYQKLILNL